MNAARVRTAARRLAALPAPEPAATDADLLARFLAARDEAAFAALVARHLPAVRAVCRSVLRDPHDADDAAQATFLVLARRAAAVRDRASVGRWLCRVAWRAANRLRGANVREAARRAAVEPDATPAPDAPAGGAELREVLDDEIGRLPERYRLAVLACYAAGTPTAEAARNLGWPKGTLLTRLAWARRRLRDRLARRGVAPAGGFAAALGTPAGSASGAVLAGRVTAAVAAGDPAATRALVSERVWTLTEGVVGAMIGTKLKAGAALAALTVALLGLGIGRMTAEPAAGPDRKAAAAPAAKPVGPREPAAADPEPAKADPAAPGNALVVRRPLGSFTREVAPFGKATLTFTDDRLHLKATVNVDKVSLAVTADADYSLNRESVVYGVITGADVSGTGEAGATAAVAPFAAIATDMPFAFRVRVEDDAITIKDLKVGPIGSPLLAELFGKGEEGKELALIAGMVGGKYKADPGPPAPAQPQPKRKL